MNRFKITFGDGGVVIEQAEDMGLAITQARLGRYQAAFELGAGAVWADGMAEVIKAERDEQ